MFNRYHGFIYPSSNKKKSNKIIGKEELAITNKPLLTDSSTQSKLQTPQTLPMTSGLPIITIPEEPQMFPANPNFKLPNIKVEDYKDIFEPKPEIKYIPPEIIPKEKEEIQMKQIKPYFEENKPKYYNNQDFEENQPKQYIKPDFQEIKQKQYIKPDFQEIKQKQYIKPDFSSLDKYKINIDNRKLQTVEIPNQKKNISIRTEFPIKTPEIISREKYIKSKSNTKKKSKSISKPKSIKKKQSKVKPKLNDVLSKIEMSDLDYKKKFEKLKKVYLKQHDSLVNVFDGYQKLYKKVKQEDQIK
jgi:hypothetical protein